MSASTQKNDFSGTMYSTQRSIIMASMVSKTIKNTHKNKFLAALC